MHARAAEAGGASSLSKRGQSMLELVVDIKNNRSVRVRVCLRVWALCVLFNAKQGSWQASSVWGPSVHGGLQWWNVCAGWCVWGVWMGAGSLHR